MVDKILAPTQTRPIIVPIDFTMTLEFGTWIRTVNDRLLIIGNTVPEGVIEASQGAEFMDTSGTTGGIKYIKRDSDIGGDKSKGWILI